MSEDVSFRAFLRACWNSIKDIYRSWRSKQDPFCCALVEFCFINAPITVLAAVLLHPLTLIATLPWMMLRWIYWAWRDFHDP